ncbi:MAG: protein translocase subunit SecF [Xanthomonadales bacterium]|nr:protein translocase subunit SecF [Xanthomonadales bacterium]
MNVFPYDSKIDFMRVRKVAMAIAVLVFVAAIVLIGTRGLNFALDFTGGTVAELKFQNPADMEDLRGRLDAAGHPGAMVQTFGSERDVLVRLQGGDGQNNITRTGDAILTALSSAENPATLVRSDFVGPQVGKELAQNGFLAVVFVALAFIVYISLRFEWKFSVAATATSIFDIVATVGFFALTQHEFNLSVLAGILSVLGYSVNDTIVVFDRVRENFRGMQRTETVTVLNRSINETLSRTILTCLSTLFAVGALYFFGGESLRGLAEALLFGIVIGTLDSIFVACPLLMMLGTSKQDLMPKIRDDSDLARRP